jgi:PAS domain-containing protein
MTFYDPRREPLLLQSVIGAMPIAAFVVGLDDAILAWNPAAERVFHVPIADAQRARFKELVPSYRVAGLRAAIEEAKAGAAPILLGEDAPGSEGTASLRYSVAPLRVGAELLGVVVTAEDHSEIEGLRSQLGIVTDDLQATSEQMEQTNEELRASTRSSRRRTPSSRLG